MMFEATQKPPSPGLWWTIANSVRVERDDVETLAWRIYSACLRSVEHSKTAAYLEQENSVLHERVRKLEIALTAEREACAKVADDYAAYFINNADGQPKPKRITAQTRAEAAKSIATLIRGRGET